MGGYTIILRGNGLYTSLTKMIWGFSMETFLGYFHLEGNGQSPYWLKTSPEKVNLYCPVLRVSPLSGRRLPLVGGREGLMAAVFSEGFA